MSVLHHEYEYSVLCAHWTLWCTCSVLLYYHSVCPRAHCLHHATRDVILQMSHLGVMVWIHILTSHPEMHRIVVLRICNT